MKHFPVILTFLACALAFSSYAQVAPPDGQASIGHRPNRISYFSLNLLSDSVRISWAVEREENIRSYLIEQSQNGVRFRPVYSVEAANDSLAVNLYQYVHPYPLPGLNFYRVSSISKDYVTRVLAKDNIIIRSYERAGDDE